MAKEWKNVLAVSCLGVLAQSSLWDIHVINMFTLEEGVGHCLVLEPDSGPLHQVQWSQRIC